MLDEMADGMRKLTAAVKRCEETTAETTRRILRAWTAMNGRVWNGPKQRRIVRTLLAHTQGGRDEAVRTAFTHLHNTDLRAKNTVPPRKRVYKTAWFRGYDTFTHRWWALPGAARATLLAQAKKGNDNLQTCIRNAGVAFIRHDLGLKK